MSSEDKVNNRCLVTDEIVRETLRADKGDAAHLISHKVVDFTNKGDNYACIVTSVVVKYTEGDVDQEETYVAKITHPMVESTEYVIGDMIHDIFEKESTAYIDIASKINDVLSQHGLQDIRFPKAYAKNLEKKKEVIIMEDLRTRGFRMFDRKRGMDVAHASLVLHELGRLHAASLLLERSLPTQDLAQTWPILVDKWTVDDSKRNLFDKMVDGQLEGGAMIMEKIPNYEHIVKWIRDVKPKAMDLFLESFKASTQFGVLNHGDCWNNNILFRYDDAGTPVEVMLVDLQGMRRVSLAVDLNYFFYSSFCGPDRKDNLQKFLEIYYTSFSKVLEAAKVPMPFTRQEIREELKNHMTFGCISGLFLIPIVLSEADDVPDMINVTEDNVEEYSKQRQDTILKMSERPDGLVRPRLLDMFDEMVEAGIINK